ncbi:uncharacterized protein B0J16DRAFT_33346 [Fusarium flagelliforme]|uniref:Bacteriophage T5 Orf172 DNA-binding domain-containing protein n=1 Tax=Fusarium flagelliforme TaxID=2675880 RepID=A0A395MSW4_9HYPO|nr:uncharacterized protein B0J16DRAFT_33346 [Fusarium flagelliforme]KAH7198057.1 hypothetical protein B0J16DRAFT_33346 [Fusarium flagelliforme]RFN51044.1 hypothetical protein FIE12Z_4685 [Fusarium flagelliforme]
MTPNHNSAEALSSLYEAFGLPESGPRYCFTEAGNGKRCSEAVPGTRRPRINTLMQTLSRHEFSNKDPIVSQSVERAITELASKLVCYRAPKGHAERFRRDGKVDKNNQEQLIDSLSSKFEEWQSKNANAGTSKSKRASNQDTRDSSQESSDQTDEDDVSSTRRQDKRQRPRLVREKPRDERELFQTPVRSRRSTSGGKRRGEESSKSLSGPYGGDDKFILSPESVASPDPDDIFTPLSAASTPCSLASTTEFESRRCSFRGSDRKRQNVSPTRGADVDSLTRDMRRKLNLVDLVSDGEYDPEEEYDSDEESDFDDFDEEGDFDEESEPDEEGESDDESSSDAQSLDAKSDEETTARSPYQPMKFALKKQPIRDVLEYMAKPVEVGPKRVGRSPGWVYGFTDPSAPGHIKIGYSQESAEQRLREWIKTCGHEELNLEFEAEMPCAVQKMEQLIHLTLHTEQEYAWCRSKKCEKRHKEWFKISREEALSVVETWRKFSKLMTYTELGDLDDIWSDIVERALRDEPCSSSSKEWLETELLTIILEQEKLAKSGGHKVER